MSEIRILPHRGGAYVASVIGLGLMVEVVAVRQLFDSVDPTWWILAALTLLSGSATVKLPSVPATISISETFVFTSVLLFGPAAGATLVALDGLIISIWLAQRRKEFYRVAFNMAAPAISIWVAAHLYYAFPAVQPLADLPDTTAVEIGAILVPLLFFTITHFLLNSTLVALAVAFETKRHPFDIWRNDFLWLSLNYFGGASLSALLVVYTRNIDLVYLGIIVPLLLILYYTFKIPMARVEDTNRHLQKVNSLYLSTIETLAMAIDAKDQVTHGHIRRVQIFAVGLARALGVRDDILLKAIEASALLHDMGKLAIPEHILNKPGKLTEAEFEKMKLHAGIGADILSAIEFPYPVVPIVRHHHENWDGTGYPTGISGTEIPIGARILSVVDCFDALTSDRPYRPAMSATQALEILHQRRGRMYDPLVVDTFVRVHEVIALETEQSTKVAAAFSEPPAVLTTADERMAWTATERAGNDLPVIRLLSLLDGPIDDLGGEHGARIVLELLTEVVPASHCVLFVHEMDSDSLRCCSSYGAGLEKMQGIRLEVGERLSGWVAANQRPIMNSDPALDVSGYYSDEPLRSALSVPLLSRGRVVGVVSCYSPKDSAFVEFDLESLDAVAIRIANWLDRSRPELLGSLEPSSALVLPGKYHFETYLSNTLKLAPDDRPELALLHLSLSKATTRHGIATLVSLLRRTLRGGDLVFATSETELVCTLTGSDLGAVDLVRGRVLAALQADAEEAGGSWSEVSVGIACAGPGCSTTAEVVANAATNAIKTRFVDNGRVGAHVLIS